MKIIIIDSKAGFNNEQIEHLKTLGEVELIKERSEVFDNPVFQSEGEKIIAVSPSLVDWEIPNSFIDKMANLKAVCLPTTSFSWVDGENLRKKDIILTNVSQYSTNSVAEYAISLMLNVVKKLPLVIKNGWQLDYDKHQGFEVKDKTMGVVGLGSIGTRIAELGKGLDMRVIYWSRESRDQRFKYMELDDLLKQADFVFPALARNEETDNIIDKEKIKLMKDTAYIVSITDDELFDLEFAQKQINKGQLAGIALEQKEKTLNDFEGNIWVTPPIAWFTKEAHEEDLRIWLKCIESVIKEEPINVVN